MWNWIHWNTQMILCSSLLTVWTIQMKRQQDDLQADHVRHKVNQPLFAGLASHLREKGKRSPDTVCWDSFNVVSRPRNVAVQEDQYRQRTAGRGRGQDEQQPWCLMLHRATWLWLYWWWETGERFCENLEPSWSMLKPLVCPRCTRLCLIPDSLQDHPAVPPGFGPDFTSTYWWRSICNFADPSPFFLSSFSLTWELYLHPGRLRIASLTLFICIHK